MHFIVELLTYMLIYIVVKKYEEFIIMFISEIGRTHYYLGITYINKCDIVNNLRLMPPLLKEENLRLFYHGTRA